MSQIDMATVLYQQSSEFSGMLENPERSGTEQNRTEWDGTRTEVIDAQYGHGRCTRGQKLALIRTV